MYVYTGIRVRERLQLVWCRQDWKIQISPLATRVLSLKVTYICLCVYVNARALATNKCKYVSQRTLTFSACLRTYVCVVRFSRFCNFVIWVCERNCNLLPTQGENPLISLFRRLFARNLISEFFYFAASCIVAVSLIRTLFLLKGLCSDYITFAVWYSSGWIWVNFPLHRLRISDERLLTKACANFIRYPIYVLL